MGHALAVATRGPRKGPSLPFTTEIADHAEKLAKIYEIDQELAGSIIKSGELLMAARKKRDR